MLLHKGRAMAGSLEAMCRGPGESGFLGLFSATLGISGFLSGDFGTLGDCLQPPEIPNLLCKT